MTTDTIRANVWPQKVCTLEVRSTIDGTNQPTLYYAPELGSRTDDLQERRPLLVALHTWSTDYTQGGGQIVFAEWCIRHEWYFLHPNFRGPNTNPSACGSSLAIQDVLDAVDHVVAKEHDKVDFNRIYLTGVSGGGYMALLLAAKFPHRWAGVSVWAAISDLEAWWKERSVKTRGPAYLQKYASDIESVVGGEPDGSQEEPIKECKSRSPLTYLSPEMIGQGHLSLDINAGITDGREGGSVPFSHSLRAYDALLPSSEKLGADWISEFYETKQCPSYDGPSEDPLYGTRKIHYRSVQDSTRITIFEGGHEILHAAALNWLEQQQLGRGTVWEVPSDTIDWIHSGRDQTQSGK